MTILLLAEGSFFPPLNASLNATSAVFLLVGFWFIKNGKKNAHRLSMIGALIASSIFLGCYVYYHYTSGHSKFPKEYPVARIVYFCILIPHVILAVANLPLVILTVGAAIKGNFTRHRKFARIAFPIWLFVSVTGVIVYFMIKSSHKHGEPETRLARGSKKLRKSQLFSSVYEGDHEILIKTEIPNVPKDGIRVFFDRGAIRLEVGTDPMVTKQIDLPLGIDLSHIEASHHAGVLTLHLPKCKPVHSSEFEIIEILPLMIRLI